MAWRWFWRMVTYIARHDIYQRMEQAYEWERKRNQELEEEITRLRQAASSASPSARDGVAISMTFSETSKETTDELRTQGG